MASKTPLTSRIDLLQGTLDLLILQTLQWGPRHGHGIGQAIRTSSEDVLQVEHGSLYPALHRLEQRTVSARIFGTPFAACVRNRVSRSPPCFRLRSASAQLPPCSPSPILFSSGRCPTPSPIGCSGLPSISPAISNFFLRPIT